MLAEGTWRSNIKNVVIRLRPTMSPPEPNKKSWRCFHCDKVFTNKEKARIRAGKVIKSKTLNNYRKLI